MKYNKQPLDIPAQIAMLKGRGLVIADEQAAEKALNKISYFRLAAYLRPMEADHHTHQFLPDTTLGRKNKSFYFFCSRLSVTYALPKLLALGNEKKNEFSFCISLVFS